MKRPGVEMKPFRGPPVPPAAHQKDDAEDAHE
jgi:hypothetical protein